MLSGISLHEHTAPGRITIHTLHGRFEVIFENQERELGPGDPISLASGMRHAVRTIAVRPIEDGSIPVDDRMGTYRRSLNRGVEQASTERLRPSACDEDKSGTRLLTPSQIYFYWWRLVEVIRRAIFYARIMLGSEVVTLHGRRCCVLTHPDGERGRRNPEAA